MRKFVFALVIGATLVGTSVASAGQAGATKPGPGAVQARAGTVVSHNSLKPGTVAAAASKVAHGKAPSSAASPFLRGYVLVDSGDLSNANSTQSFGSAACPTGTVAFGGGVYGDSSSVFQDVNSSFPEVSGSVAIGWGAYVDNFSGGNSGFHVYAVCAKKPRYYAVVSLGFANPAGTQTVGQTVQCPLAPTGKRMKPFGGGGFGSSTGLLQNINSSLPVAASKSWRVDMNNASSFDETGAVYAVCGLRKGWAVVAGTSVTNAANSQTFASASCASGKVSVGGGVYSSSGSTSVNLNSTWPASASSWGSFENNATGSDVSMTPYVVCLT